MQFKTIKTYVMENTFIKQTSLDYSLPYHIVEAIYKSGMMNGYSMKN